MPGIIIIHGHKKSETAFLRRRAGAMRRVADAASELQFAFCRAQKIEFALVFSPFRCVSVNKQCEIALFLRHS